MQLLGLLRADESDGDLLVAGAVAAVSCGSATEVAATESRLRGGRVPTARAGAVVHAARQKAVPSGIAVRTPGGG